MRLKLCCAALVLLCAAGVFAQFEAPADTVRADTLAAWADTSLVPFDSLAVMQPALHRSWLYPVGIVIVTCVGFLTLFTVRSR